MNRGMIRKLERVKLALMIRGREEMCEKENGKGKTAFKEEEWRKNWQKNITGKTGFKDEGWRKN